MLFMKQGIQTNFPDADLKAAGCHYFALMKYLEIKHGVIFSLENLTNYFKAALKEGTMGFSPADKLRGVGDNCNVLDAPGLLNMVLKEKVYTKYQRDIKTRPDDDLCIVRLVKPGITHFITDYKGMTFDPLNPMRAAALTYTVDSYRILN